MESVKSQFESMLTMVNKIASLKLENDESIVMNSMLDNGIGASANDAIERMCNALNTKETNNFTVKQEKETFFCPTYSAKDFNYLNRDIEAILQSGYNAKIIDQHINLSNMLNGNPTKKQNGEILFHLTDKMNMNNPYQTTSYSTFDAKANTILNFIALAKESNVRLAPANNLYLYNTIINLLNDVDTHNINTDENVLRGHLTSLRTVENENLQKFLGKAKLADCMNVNTLINMKREELDEARKRLESQIFNKVEPKFDMKKCHNNFANRVLDIQKQQGIELAC